MTQQSESSNPSEKSSSPTLGFLTVLQEAGGYVGGYLVTNFWGRPLEFRLTSAVQPNKVQQILYGGTLLPFICADLVAKTLVDKAGIAVQMIVTDREAVLELRLKVEVPVVCVAAPPDPLEPSPPQETVVAPATTERGPVLCHPRFLGDAVIARDWLTRLEEWIDLTEPFVRIREAVAEARRMGLSRAA